MRWLAIPLTVALAWLAFTLTPLWSLYDLSRAVRDRDVPYVEQHVNFRTLRLSLVRQISAAVKSASEADPTLEPRERQRLNETAVGLALAFAETMVTAETVIDLLDDGWPQRLDLPQPAEHRPAALSLDRIGRLAAYYFAAEMRGFRTVVIGIPPDTPREQQMRIRLRLRGTTWRLVDLELTDALRAQMAQRLSRILVRARAPEKVPPAQP